MGELQKTANIGRLGLKWLKTYVSRHWRWKSEEESEHQTDNLLLSSDTAIYLCHQTGLSTSDPLPHWG